MMQYDQPDYPAARQVCYLPVEAISPRATLSYAQEDSGSLEALAQSIRQNGLTRPVTVQRLPGGRYGIVSGNRRLMACRMLGMTHIGAVILPDFSRRQSPRELMDALRSHQLHYLDEAEALCTLNAMCAMNREQLSRELGLTVSVISSRMRLMTLDEGLRRFLRETGLPERVALALLRLPDPAEQLRVARRAAREKLDIREVELLVASALLRHPPAQPPRHRVITLIRDYRPYLNGLRSIVSQMRQAGMSASINEETRNGQMLVEISFSTRHRRADKYRNA